jgi:uncharacterized phiE125 gp8 family phage protein
MNFTGPWSDYYPDGFPGWAYGYDGDARSQVAMRKLTTSSGFPIALDEILSDLRVDSDDESRTVQRLARAAAAFLEKRTGIAVLQGTYEAKFSRWNYWRPWEFMRSPLRAVKEISWLDGTASPPDWVDVPIEKFFVTELAKSFLVVPLQGMQMPTIWAPFHGIRVRFNAGFDIVAESGVDNESGEGDQDALPIPDDIRTTLVALTGHFYENRELFAADKIAQVEASAGSLLASNRMFW